MAWRLALDMGTNSLGWTAFRLNEHGEPVDLMDAGVRIFPDGREPGKAGRVGDSNAVARRTARGIRKNRDRHIERKKHIMDFLVLHGLMPDGVKDRKALESLDPYELRSKAVSEILPPHHLGRALFQLAQRRGFKSNRQTDGEEETGKIKPKMGKLRAELDASHHTLGQWLHARIQQGESTRFHTDTGDYYPDRQMYLDEFDAIRRQQEAEHSLSAEAWDTLRDYHIFYQRPLKAVERGKCEFFHDEVRAHKDLPMAHDFRIYQEVNNLKWIDSDRVKHELTAEQRDYIVEKLQHQKSIKFSALRKFKDANKQPLFPRDSLFNLESEARDGLKGNETACTMRSDKFLAETWDQLAPECQNDVVEALHEAKDNEELIALLTAPAIGLTPDQAAALCRYKRSSATMHVSRKFMQRIIPIMRDDYLRYDEAVENVYDDDGVFLHHSHRTVDKLLDQLPYYGALLTGSVIGGKPGDFDATDNPEQHYGKIGNPTVHVALNQLRKLVNRLLSRYGKPANIHVELTRDMKKAKKAREEIAKENAKNAKANQRRKEEIEDLPEVDVASGLDIKRMKLWEELNSNGLPRTCVFCGKPISAGQLYNGDAEIEHILPFSRTLDNSTANLTMAHRHCNRAKGNRTPHEAFGTDQHASAGYVWRDICDRAAKLPSNKQWRFDPDAMERFEKDNGFIKRQLHDNAYISRITKRYLSHICPDNKIVTIPGQLTAMLRGKWMLDGLIGNFNYKERTDHRHHVIDAFVVGLTDRSMLNRISRDTARGVDVKETIQLPDITPLRTQLDERLKTLIVSFKRDHGSNGKMYAETAYGKIQKDRRDPLMPDHSLVTRRALTGLTSMKQLEEIRCPDLRLRVIDFVVKAKEEGIKLDKALAEFSKETGVKRVRTLVKNQSASPIASAPYKYYAPDSFVCVDIWQVPKGKPGKWKQGSYSWQGYFIPYSSCGPDGVPSPEDYRQILQQETENQADQIHPAARFVMRLFKNDMVSVMDGETAKIMVVKGFSTTDNKVFLKLHTSADMNRQFTSINVLKDKNMAKIHVTEDGTVQ